MCKRFKIDSQRALFHGFQEILIGQNKLGNVSEFLQGSLERLVHEAVKMQIRL